MSTPVQVKGRTDQKAAVNTQPGSIVVSATGQQANEAYKAEVYQGDPLVLVGSETQTTNASGSGTITVSNLAAGEYEVKLIRVVTGEYEWHHNVTVPAPPA